MCIRDSCRAVYEKYYSELFTGAREPKEMVETINEELEKAGWETIREEAQKDVYKRQILYLK